MSEIEQCQAAYEIERAKPNYNCERFSFGIGYAYGLQATRHDYKRVIEKLENKIKDYGDISEHQEGFCMGLEYAIETLKEAGE